MVLANFLIIGTPTFYILLLVLAAAAIVLVIRPKSPGAVKEVAVAGQLIYGMPDPEPRLELLVTGEGETVLIRSGWQGVALRGVTADVEIKGYDISITEQIIYGSGDEIDCVQFHLPTLAPMERYHINYKSIHLSRNVAFTFRVNPGLHIHRAIG